MVAKLIMNALYHALRLVCTGQGLQVATETAVALDAASVKASFVHVPEGPGATCPTFLQVKKFVTISKLEINSCEIMPPKVNLLLVKFL